MTKNTAFFVIILTSVLANLYGVSAYTNSDVIAAYSFDSDFTDGTGVYDLTNNGAVIDTVTYKLGSGSANFDATDYTVPSSNWGLFDGNHDFSISLWFKIDDTSVEHWLWSSYGESVVSIRVLAGGNLQFVYRVGGTDYSLSTTISTGTWYHVVARYAPGVGATLFLNNAVAASETTTGTFDALTGYSDTISSRGSDFTYPMDGHIDEFVIFSKYLNDAEVASLYAGDTYPYTTSSWSVHVTDLYDDTGLEGVNVTFAPGCWNITDSTGTTTVTNESDGCAGINGTLSWTASKTGYFDASGTVAENSTANTGMYQGAVNINGIYRLVDGALLNASTAWSVVTGGGKTYTGTATSYPENIYLTDGSNTLTLKHSGDYYDKDFTVNITAPQTTTATVTEVYNNQLTVTATDWDGVSISTFNVTATNTTYNFTETVSTSSGSAVLNLTQNIGYNITIDASGYVVETQAYTPTTASDTLSFTGMKVINTFNITILDEQTNTELNESFVVELISDSFASNYTVTGNEVITLLTPDDYEIRYYQTNGSYTSKRSYFVNLTPKSYQELKLYALKDSASTYYTPVVIDDSGVYVEGANIKLVRGYIENNTYVGRTVEMAKTDPNGQGVLRIEPNNVYYKFIITKGDASLETNYFKITQQTHTFQIKTGGLLQSTSLELNKPYTLEYLNDTQTFRLTWNDDTNLIINGCLEVEKLKDGAATTVANSCSSGSSGSIVYTVTDTNKTVYRAKAKIETNTENSELLDVLDVSFTNTYQIWGLLGVLLTLVVFLFTVFLAGDSSESVAVSGTVALMFCGAIGIISQTWTSIVGVFIIAGIIVYKTRT